MKNVLLIVLMLLGVSVMFCEEATVGDYTWTYVEEGWVWN